MTPGGPFFSNGFNGKIAWAGTASNPDTADILRFQLNTDGTQYLSRDGWKPIERWEETIKVKTNDGYRNQVVTLRSTDIGAVWAVEGNYVYVSKIPDFIDTPELASYAFQRLKVVSVKEFMELFKTKNYMVGHKFAADLEGNIGYIYPAPWPKRNPELDWSRPVDGTDPRSDWLGYVTYEELPKVFNPASGWLQNCNGHPQYVTENSGITSDLPARVNGTGFGERGKRLTELLSGKQILKIGNMFGFSLDTLVWKARVWAPILVNAFDTYADAMGLRGTDIETAIKLFRNWDYRAEKNSKAMAVFHYFYNRFNTPSYQNIIALEDASLIPEASKQALLTELGYAATQVRSYFGRIDKPWGEVQYFKYGDKEFSIAGSGGSGGWLQTLRSAANQTEQSDGRISVTGGSAYQYIIELSESPKMWSGIPVGESNNPRSKHFNDLTELFSQKKYKPVWYTWKQLKKHIESDVTLSTKKKMK
jgi:acyl-homoserine lactone acylase PvdQ